MSLREAKRVDPPQSLSILISDQFFFIRYEVTEIPPLSCGWTTPPRRGVCSEECESNLPRLFRYSRSTASIPLSTYVDLSSTHLTPMIPARSPNIYVRGRRKSPIAPHLFFVEIGANPLLLPCLHSSDSHTEETEGSSYLCKVQGYV